MLIIACVDLYHRCIITKEYKWTGRILRKTVIISKILHITTIPIIVYFVKIDGYRY